MIRLKTVAFSLLGLSLFGGVACGTRSQIPPGEPCAKEGAVRPCESTCGEGTELCGPEGYWLACDAVGHRNCDSLCGTGTQSCAADAWETACHIESRVQCQTSCGTGTQACVDGKLTEPCDARGDRSCQNTCGTGRQSCELDTWTPCDAVGTRGCSSICGTGKQSCENETWSACDAPRPKAPKLLVTIRDFNDTHPDFERPQTKRGDDPGMVGFDLGLDDKPVYQGNPTTRSTSGKSYFDQWYRDVPWDATTGLGNMTTTREIALSEVPSRPGVYRYSASAFFPIDNQLLGNQKRLHNYHFTVEAVTRFNYQGGETFTFRGDDDLWVFINRRLAIDLGGTHQAEMGSIKLDAQAQKLGLTPGQIYPLHLFFAERATVDSTFNIETTIAEWDFCD